MLIKKKETKLLAVIALLSVLLFFLIANSVNGGHVSQLEAKVFSFINGLPSVLYPIMQAMQYLGLLFAPILFALIALFKKRYLLSFLLVMIIPSKIILEKVSKHYFLRERPAVYIEDAILRGDVQSSGLSFYSGHAFIVAMAVTVAFLYMNKRWRIITSALAFGCVLARVYLGAHLPLDVVAGILAGIATGCVLLLVVKVAKKLLMQSKVKVQ